MPPQHRPADLVAVLDGLHEDFRKRHRKDRDRAEAAWRSLVGKRDALQADTDFGDPFDPPHLPRALEGSGPLYVLKGLPHAFRAVYEVLKHPVDGLVVRVVWIGDHGEYDRAFGYATS